MLTHTSPIDIETILRGVRSKPPFPSAADRQAWAAARERLGAQKAQAWIQAAEVAAREPIPSLPASLWLECKRTGVREGYEDPYYRRRTMMSDLVLGECLEHQGRFLDPLMNVIWAICEESSWVYPAHHTDLADMAHPYIDLGAASTGFDLAEVDGLIGLELPGEVGLRIRYEVNQRLFTPLPGQARFLVAGKYAQPPGEQLDRRVQRWGDGSRDLPGAGPGPPGRRPGKGHALA